VELESYSLVLLRRPTDAPDLPEEELDRLQAAHLAFLDEQAAAGKLVGAGPFREQVDESLRGLCFYACGIEETRRLAAADPMVTAGRLEAEVMTWLTRRGSVSFHR
jgi:uncharacterized protein YciI